MPSSEQTQNTVQLVRVSLMSLSVFISNLGDLEAQGQLNRPVAQQFRMLMSSIRLAVAGTQSVGSRSSTEMATEMSRLEGQLDILERINDAAANAAPVESPQAINPRQGEESSRLRPSTPDRDHGEGEADASDAESNDTRVARYLNSTMEEVSDPEMWMGLHRYSPEPDSNQHNVRTVRTLQVPADRLIPDIVFPAPAEAERPQSRNRSRSPRAPMPTADD